MNLVIPSPYQVEAYNTSKASENKIHDDAVARRFGFSGGLVPGVDVYGYMTHQPVARWGRAWLERGVAECRLLKPVYDGENATVTAEATADGLVLQVTSRGMLCATGTASLPDAAPQAPALDSFAVPPTCPEDRPPADETSLARRHDPWDPPPARHTRVRRRLSARCPRNRPALRARRAGAPGDAPTGRQLGAQPQRRARPVDACRQHGAPLCARPGRRRGHRARPGRGELRPQGPSVRRGRTAGDCQWRRLRWRTSRTPRSIARGRWPRRRLLLLGHLAADSPPGLAAVWTFTYHLPASRSLICASVSVLSPWIGLVGAVPSGRTTPAFAPDGGGTVEMRRRGRPGQICDVTV